MSAIGSVVSSIGRAFFMVIIDVGPLLV